MSEPRRQIVLTKRMHEVLKDRLEEAHERECSKQATRRAIETRKVLNIAKAAKFVVWDDEAKLWVSPGGVDSGA